MMIMMTNKEKKLLNDIKRTVYRLRKNGQLPYNLYILVLNLSYESDIERVKILRDLCEKYTRIGGYYYKFADASYECDKELKEKGLI